MLFLENASWVRAHSRLVQLHEYLLSFSNFLQEYARICNVLYLHSKTVSLAFLCYPVDVATPDLIQGVSFQDHVVRRVVVHCIIRVERMAITSAALKASTAY
jgi:hypothetical protein